MNTNELLVNWSTLSLEEIETRLQEGADEEAARQLFGEAEMAELQSVLEQPPAQGTRKAVVLLPGVMGSLLTSIRGVTTLLWINPLLFLKGEAHYLELNQDGTADGSPEIDAVPLALEKMVYTKAALTLRRRVELYEFPYDWRRPIETNGDLLHQYLERWAAGDPNKKFTLVGHSMGGLVSRAYLARHTQAAEQRIERLIMHGTPHYGAAGAIESMIQGNSMMELTKKLNNKNVPRRLLLNMPSIYQILPPPLELFPKHRPYPANWNLYNAQEWRLADVRQDYLNAAKGFHHLLAESDPQIETIEIAGCNLDTVVDIVRTFDEDEKPVYQSLRTGVGPDSGDATVPLWSALLPGAKVYYVEEVHRHLPKKKKVLEATLELIHDGEPDLPTELPERETGLFDFFEFEAVEATAEDLKNHIEEGTASEEELAKLYFAF